MCCVQFLCKLVFICDKGQNFSIMGCYHYYYWIASCTPKEMSPNRCHQTAVSLPHAHLPFMWHHTCSNRHAHTHARTHTHTHTHTSLAGYRNTAVDSGQSFDTVDEFPHEADSGEVSRLRGCEDHTEGGQVTGPGLLHCGRQQDRAGEWRHCLHLGCHFTFDIMSSRLVLFGQHS